MDDSDDELFMDSDSNADEDDSRSIDYPIEDELEEEDIVMKADIEDEEDDTASKISCSIESVAAPCKKRKVKKSRNDPEKEKEQHAFDKIMDQTKSTINDKRNKQLFINTMRSQISHLEPSQLHDDGYKRKCEYEREMKEHREKLIAFRKRTLVPLQKRILPSANSIQSDSAKPSGDGILSSLQINMTSDSYYPSNSVDVEFYTKQAPPNTFCRHCTLQIPGKPYPMPMKYHEHLGAFFVEGQYCNLNCVYASICAHNIMKKPLFRHMCSKVYKIKYNTQIIPTPSPFLMKKFGGDLSDVEFANLLRGDEVVYQEEISIPLIPFTSGLHLVTQKKLVFYQRHNDNEVSEMINNIRTHNYVRAVQHNKKIQRSVFAQAVDIDQQIRLSHQRVNLQMGTLDSETKKKRTLRDFLVKNTKK